MTESQARTPGAALTAVVLCLLMAAAAWVRLDGVGYEAIGHTELFVPGIELPADMTFPGPRHTLRRTLSSTVLEEPHPPGYYAFMLGWTSVFGADAVAIRLPSVIAGILSVLLVWLICRLCGLSWLTQVLAAGAMAFSGHHVYWSQMARMYEPGSAFALCSTLCLLWMIRSPGVLSRLAYGVSTLSGLSMLLFVWPVLAAQMLWTLARRLRLGEREGILRTQLLVAALGAPLLAIAVFQSRRPSYLSLAAVPETVLGYAGLGFLVDLPGPWTDELPFHWVFLVVLALVGCVLTFLGARQGARAAVSGRDSGPPRSVLVGSALVGVAAIAGFVVLIVASKKSPEMLLPVSLVAALPVGLVVADIVFDRRRATNGDPGGESPWLSGGMSLVVLAAIVPVVLMAALSLASPILQQRTAMCLTPYLLIVSAAGVAGLLARSRAWSVLLAALLALHVFSAVHYRQKPKHPRDWRALAEAWLPRLEAADVIYVRRHWKTSPIFLRVSASEFRFVTKVPPLESVDGRIWVLDADGEERKPTLEAVLRDRKAVETLGVRGVSVTLYAPP